MIAGSPINAAPGGRFNHRDTTASVTRRSRSILAPLIEFNRFGMCSNVPGKRRVASHFRKERISERSELTAKGAQGPPTPLAVSDPGATLIRFQFTDLLEASVLLGRTGRLIFAVFGANQNQYLSGGGDWKGINLVNPAVILPEIN